MELLDWNSIDHKKHNGKSKLLCPKCSSIRTNKKDKSLSVDYELGAAKCHYCGVLSFKENHLSNARDNYKIPEQNWKNYTNFSDKVIKYIESRKIDQYIVKELGWTEENGEIVFNYFEGETLVNKKYRTLDKKFRQIPNTKSIFYNINAAVCSEQVIIVEGEFDVASFYQIGVKNVISIPNGANNADNYWKNSEQYLKDVKQFIIAVDNDEMGIKARDEFAQRLGKWRCKYVTFKGKDANEDLLSGDLETSLKNMQPFPVGGTIKASDIKEKLDNLYDNGIPQTIYPKSYEFGNLKRVFSVMRGQLTVVTGIPSHGKSNFNDWYILNLVKDYNLKASWFTPEHMPAENFHENLMQKVIGKRFHLGSNKYDRIKPSEKESYYKWAEDRIYIIDDETGESPTWDWLINKFKEHVYSFNTDIFIIDAFNKLILPKGDNLQNINNVLTKLTSFCRSYNVFVFLVAHPRKMEKDQQGNYHMPSLYDVSGSADFRNQSHNGYTIYREFIETGKNADVTFKNTKTKLYYQGEIGGEVKFHYNKQNGRYYAEGYKPNNESMISTFDEQLEVEMDEVPF